MKVWIVMELDYDSYEILGGFSNKEDAQTLKDSLDKEQEHKKSYAKDYYYIEEVGVDEWSKHI